MKFVVLGVGLEMYQKGWVCMYRVVVLFIKTFLALFFISVNILAVYSEFPHITGRKSHRRLLTSWYHLVLTNNNYLIMIMIRKTLLNVLWHFSRLFQVSRIPTKQPALSVIEQEALQDIEMECGRWHVQDIHQPWLEQHLLVGLRWTNWEYRVFSYDVTSAIIRRAESM